MRLLPTRLYPRLVLLLASVLVLIGTTALAVLHLTHRELPATHVVRDLIRQAHAADVLLADPDQDRAEARILSYGFLRHTRPPPPPTFPMPFLREVEIQFSSRMPGRELRLSTIPETALWIAALPPAQGWVGIPTLVPRRSLLWASGIALAVTILLVLGGAAWYTRALTQPLRQLAEAAPQIASGEPVPLLPSNAIAEVGELAAALDQAATDVRVAARERELLLAGLSHDMRTPLARLRFALELVEGDMPTREGMEQDLSELDTILEHFIAYVRDGRDEPSMPVDMTALAAEAIAVQTRMGRTWQLHSDANIFVFGKPLALRRALDNLLENAARHGAAPFEIEVLRSNTGASIAVRDAGRGVPTEALASLGRPFHRVDAARQGPGTGLGLASVMRIAAWHGGALMLRNRPEGGFEAELRLHAART